MCLGHCTSKCAIEIRMCDGLKIFSLWLPMYCTYLNFRVSDLGVQYFSSLLKMIG